jgi:hypothetical protein
MGYRSEVAIAFYSVDDDSKAVIKLWLDENLPFKDWSKDEFWKEVRGGTGWIFHAEEVKWYESYPDVQAVEKAMDRFRKLFIDESNVGALEFARIGETYEDIEFENWGDSDLVIDICRSINIDN